jgi:hypothetical protein
MKISINGIQANVNDSQLHSQYGALYHFKECLLHSVFLLAIDSANLPVKFSRVVSN